MLYFNGIGDKNLLLLSNNAPNALNAYPFIKLDDDAILLLVCDCNIISGNINKIFSSGLLLIIVIIFLVKTIISIIISSVCCCYVESLF